MRVGLINSYYYGTSQSKEQNFGKLEQAVRKVMTASEYRKALEDSLRTGNGSALKGVTVTNRTIPRPSTATRSVGQTRKP